MVPVQYNNNSSTNTFRSLIHHPARLWLSKLFKSLAETFFQEGYSDWHKMMGFQVWRKNDSIGKPNVPHLQQNLFGNYWMVTMWQNDKKTWSELFPWRSLAISVVGLLCFMHGTGPHNFIQTTILFLHHKWLPHNIGNWKLSWEIWRT